MKKIVYISVFVLMALSTKATIHIVKVWDGYLSFLPAQLTINLGDTIQWLPLDQPSMMHTVTSTTIPFGAAYFDQVWKAPADTFFQYIPQVAGLYNYVCTPHASSGMAGSFTVLSGTTSIFEIESNKEEILAYPNPVINTFRLNDENIGYPFKIYNINGKIILSGISRKEINISLLTKGTYLLEIMSNKSNVQKIQKL
ncbi:T9SS type A sorting domain-containing protein [Bacteroidota bacterium]